MILLVFLNAIFAASFPLVKGSLAYAKPIFSTGIRMVVAGLGLSLFALSRGYRITFCKETVFLLMQISLFNVFLTNALSNWGAQYTSSGKAAFIFNLTPFISAVIAYFIFSEQLTIKKIVALIIGFASCLPLFIISSPDESGQFQFLGFLSLGEIALLVSAMCSVWGWIMVKRTLQNLNCSLVLLNGLSMLIGGLFFFPTAWAIEVGSGALITHFYLLLVYLVPLLIISNIIGYNSYAYLLDYYSTTLLFFAGFSAPLFATVYGWLFLGEKIDWHFGVAVIGVFVGLTLFWQEDKRLGYLK